MVLLIMRNLFLIFLFLLLSSNINGFRYDEEFIVEGFYVRTPVKYNTLAKTEDGEVKK